MIEEIILALAGIAFAAHNPKVTKEMIIGESLGILFLFGGNAAICFYWNGDWSFPWECWKFLLGCYVPMRLAGFLRTG